MAKAENAREAAVRMLAMRRYSSLMLAEKLIEKGYPEDEASQVVQWLCGLGYLDDREYADGVIRSQRARGYGPGRISRYLQAHGLTREEAEAALLREEDAGQADAAAIDAFLARRAPANPDRREKEKITAALIRRGYAYQDIKDGFERLEISLSREEDG